MLKRKKQIIAKVMATTMLASTLASTFATNVSAAEPQTKATVSETTIAGDDRYKTAVEISKNYSSTSKHAVIVNGQKGIVDALTATPYASLKKAPILMTQSTKLNEDTKKELTRRGVKTVDIVGGVNSVSDSVKAEIEAMGITVNRIAGDSKYDTALEVAKQIDDISDISKIAVANGEVLADAVSVAAPAAQNKMPIILAHPTKGLDAETKKYIDSQGVSKSYVIGGTSSVSTTTQNSLPGTKKRLEGTNRQGTNASVIKEFYTSSSYDNMYVAKSGQVNKADEIADALAVGVLAASNQDPVMLVGKNLGSTQKTLLEGKDLEKITKVGGNIPTASIDAIKNTQSSTKTVTTVAELKTALANAKDGDVINFNPSGTISEAVSLSTTKNVAVNLNGTHSGTVSVDMANGTLNINGNVSNKVSVDAVKAISVKSGVTVKHLEIKSGSKNASIANSGTVTTFDVLATGVKITGSGKITTLNPQGDTDYSAFNGEIGNLDTTKPVLLVTSPNGKQIQVNFNKKLDVNPSVAITGGTANTAVGSNIDIELNSDMNKMTITAKGNYYFNGSYGLEITGMKSNYVELEDYRTTIVVDDKTSPSVESVKYNQNTDNIEITLSEPIYSTNLKASGLVLDFNEVAYEGSAKIETALNNSASNEASNKIILSRPDELALSSKNIKVYIEGLKDNSGNVMKAYSSSSFEITNDAISVISLTQIANNKVRMVFNKAVTVKDKSKFLIYKDGLTAEEKNNLILKDNSVNKVEVNTTLDPTGKTVDITLQDKSVIFGTNSSQKIKWQIDASALTDSAGTDNKKLVSSTYKTLNKDETKPTASSAKLTTNKEYIEIKFSEAIGTITKSDITLTNNSIAVSNDNLIVIPKPETEDTILIKINGKNTYEAGNYQIHFKDGAVKDLSGNGIKAYNTDIISVTSSTPAIKLPVTITQVDNSGQSLGDNIIIVKATEGKVFRHTTKDELLYNLSNERFKLKGNNLPEGTKINFVNDSYNQIKIELPLETIVTTGNASFEVSGLNYVSGEIITTTVENVEVKDNKAPELTGAQIITIKNDAKPTAQIIGYELKLTFNEAVLLDLPSSESNGESTAIVGTMGDILDYIELKTSTSSTATKYVDKDQVCTYQVNPENTKEVIIKINKELKADKSGYENIAFDTIASATSPQIKIIENIDIIRDAESILLENGKTISVKKGISKTISKSNKTEA